MISLEKFCSLDIAVEVLELFPGSQVEVLFEGGKNKLFWLLCHISANFKFMNFSPYELVILREVKTAF